MLEVIGLAIIEKTLKRIAGNLLEKLGQKATDNLVELVCDKLTLFNKEGKDNQDDLIKSLKEIPELQNITNNDISTAFNITFGDMSNSQVAIAQNGNIFQIEQLIINGKKEEMGSLIQDTVAKLGKTTNDINNFPALLSSVNKSIVDGYDYEDKKYLLKKLIKERVKKSVNDNFIDIREYDTAIEIIAKLTKDELNLLALCRIALGLNLNNILRIEIIKQYNLDIFQIDRIVAQIYLKIMVQFLPIDIIDETSTTTIFTQYGLNTTNLVYPEPIFVYKGRSMLNQILVDPSMEYLKKHQENFQQHILALANHRTFQKISGIYLDEKMRGITFDIPEILKDITE